MTDQNTFWKLINYCSIEIPTIQRDYTYGRKNASTIRKKLIKSILTSLKEENALHLDFIYGRILGIDNLKTLERNKQSVDVLLKSLSSYADNLHLKINYTTENKYKDDSDIITFIPLDGQQRLTTLFLIHWYFLYITKDDKLTILKRFRYTTRNSSREFLEMICTDFKSDIKGKISETIINHESFFTIWKNDPTVSSMLVVLDEIQNEVTKQNLNKEVALQKLKDSELISFDFFNLEDFELTDELYVKMNARGKKLSSFENFKAWLLKNHSFNISVDDWKKKLDIQWNDLFWNVKNETDKQIDTQYLQYFKNMFLGDYVSQSQNLSDIDLSIHNLRTNKDFDPIELFESERIFQLSVDNYLICLDSCLTIGLDTMISKTQNSLNEITLHQFLFSSNHNLNWWDTTMYYAITRYLIHTKGSSIYLNQWIRFISNLIYNTPIESPKLYAEACQSINELLNRLGDSDVYSVISKLESHQINFFLEKQREEEIWKAKLTASSINIDWEQEIQNLERNEYFYGQIGFVKQLLDNDSIENFRSIASKLQKLFSSEVLDDSTYLLFRSFLTFEDCFFENGDTLTYPSNSRGTLRNRNENWRRFIDKFPNAIRSMLKEITLNADIISTLNRMINESEENGSFRSTIIRQAEILKYPQNNHIRRYSHGYYPLRKTRIYGYYCETNTYYWYLKNKQTNNGLRYKFAKGEDDNPGIYNDNIDSFVYFDHLKNNYRRKGNPDSFVTIEEAVKTL